MINGTLNTEGIYLIIRQLQESEQFATVQLSIHVIERLKAHTQNS